MLLTFLGAVTKNMYRTMPGNLVCCVTLGGSDNYPFLRFFFLKGHFEASRMLFAICYI